MRLILIQVLRSFRPILSTFRSPVLSRFCFGSVGSKQHFSMSMDNQSGSGKAQQIVCSKAEYIQEGKAKILKELSKNVFYNPVQEFNRDLSVAVLSTHFEDHLKDQQLRKLRHLKKKDLDPEPPTDSVCLAYAQDDTSLPEAGKVYPDGMVVLEALAATGLRSVRYAQEVPGIKQIVANDLSSSAIESLKANISLNNVEDLVSVSHSDASLVMYLHRPPAQRFDVIDLDPYGSPSHFLDGAVQALNPGGLLMVTCTDMAVLAGNSPETCYSKYGAISLRNHCVHEMALRIALQCIESHANRYGRYITPLLSVSADFYIRLFVRINSSPSICKRSISKLSMVYQCVGCDTLTLQPLGNYKNINPDNPAQMRTVLPHVPSVQELCPHCDKRHHLGGPIWSAPMHDKAFVSRLLDLVSEEDAEKKFGTAKRLEGMLSVIYEELDDIPLYYKIDKLCSHIGVGAMPALKFCSALLNAGYRVSQSHCKPMCFKSDAPQDVVWDILREWEKQNPASKKRLGERSVASNILSKAISTKVNFDLHPDANPESKQNKKCRYQINPLPYWGPGIRSIANLQDGSIQEKQKRNQGKKSRKRKHPDDSQDDPSHVELDETISSVESDKSNSVIKPDNKL